MSTLNSNIHKQLSGFINLHFLLPLIQILIFSHNHHQHGARPSCSHAEGTLLLPHHALHDKLRTDQPQQAEKAAAGATGGLSFFGGRQEKWENAADLYNQAANAFRMQKQSKATPAPLMVLCSNTLNSRQGSRTSIRTLRRYPDEQTE
jgi:hypothetical protein